MSQKTIEQLNQQIVEHNSFRKHFERTPEELALSIQEEARELVASIQESLVTGDVFPVVSEIGDLYILLAQLCHDTGINPAQAMELKAIRNQYKYGDFSGNNGHTREEYIFTSKEYWKRIGGDAVFSHLYLDILANGDVE